MKKLTLLILSIAGFFDSAYLTILHYKNTIPPCEIAKGCETVLTSQFSTIFGIPIALVGTIYFLVLIVALLLNKLIYFKLLAFAGLFVSIFLFGIQAFILKEYCQYCLLVEAIIVSIFILSFFRKRRK